MIFLKKSSPSFFFSPLEPVPPMEELEEHMVADGSKGNPFFLPNVFRLREGSCSGIELILLG